MNAPERSQSYVLEPGEPKISHAKDSVIPNAANFQINKEDHTIGNLLKADLVRNKRVVFAAYQHPHPLQNFINLKVQTNGEKTPLKELVVTCKNLGTLIVRNKKKITTGIITDGQIRRLNEKRLNFNSLKVKDVMTKNPIKVEKDTLATKALSIMNDKKITSLCVRSPKNKLITIGILHIHNILDKNIY